MIIVQSELFFAMKSSVLVSVLMSVYNTDFALIKRAIDSVLNQDFQNFELIIIDDGSEIGFQNQLLKYVVDFQSKITYLRHANCGQSESINRGILLSNGEYVTVIDADDEYKPNHLRSCINEVNGLDLIASTTETVVGADEDFYVPDRFDQSKFVHVDNCILFATLFGKREVFANFKFQKRYSADSHFYDMASQKYIVKKVDLRTYIYYRNSPSSICSVIKKNALLPVG